MFKLIPLQFEVIKWNYFIFYRFEYKKTAYKLLYENIHTSDN